MIRGAFLTLAALLVSGAAAMAQTDEIEEGLELALEAYRAGDIAAAKEEIDYVAQLLNQMKAEGLAAFLPEPMEGWTREEGENQSAAMGIFGGGLAASATYTRDRDRVEIQLMAENQMVTSMAAMFANTATMGAMGKVRRIRRQMVLENQQGELQAVIDNRVFVQVSGSAPAEDKLAYFEAIDLRGLKDF